MHLHPPVPKTPYLGVHGTGSSSHAHGIVDISFADSEGRKFYASLLQTDGVITGSIIPGDRRWNLRCDELVVRGGDLPQVLRDSLEGRRLGELFQNSEIPGDAVIVSVEEVASVDPDGDDDGVDGWLRLTLEVPIVEIDGATGEAREDPATGPAYCARRARSLAGGSGRVDMDERV